LIIGLVLALGTGALLLTYLTSLRPSGTATQMRGVLVAIHDIPARTDVTSDLFDVVQRTATQVDPDAISDPKDLSGSYALVSIPAGSVVTRSKIALTSSATLPAKLAVGMRAISIAIDNVKGIAGLITPGDRVDVIAIPAIVTGETPRGYAILRGALVLALGSDLQTTTVAAAGLLAGTPAPLTTVTLAVTPAQADLIDGADLSTTLRLALRNSAEPVDSLPAQSLRIASLGSAPVPAPAAAAAAPTAAPAPGATSSTSSTPSGVIVIDGDQTSPGTASSR
jgi:pilus assembly protein CpaB